MEENKNNKEFLPRNSSTSTPAQLLSSVLEQRYSRKSNANIKAKDEKPDPMTFPAVQKALGSVYSTIVEIVGEEETEEVIETLEENDEQDISAEQAIENARGLNERLLDMVNEIEQNDKLKEEERKNIKFEVQKKKADPYNRELNSYSGPSGEIETINVTENMKIETIVSNTRGKRNKRFRNEARANEK